MYLAMATSRSMTGLLISAAPRLVLVPQPSLKMRHCNNSRRSSWHCVRSSHQPGQPDQSLNLPELAVQYAESAPKLPVHVQRTEAQLPDQYPKSSPSTFQYKLGLVDNAVESTLEHHLWTAFGFGVATVTIGEAFEQPLAAVHYLQLVIGTILGYVLADLVSGIIHWFTDNYGDATTPHFGPSIDAAQGHHQRPWVITTRHFANNVHVVTRISGLVLIPFMLLPGTQYSFFHTLLGSFATFGMMSQQCHAWAHMNKSRLPGVVRALQSARLLLSAQAHAPHHKQPHESCYCLVNGMWNDVLKRTNFFLRLERAVYARWGVAPRCWTGADHFNEAWRQRYFEENGDVEYFEENAE